MRLKFRDGRVVEASGHMDFPAVRAALERNGYNGFVSVKVYRNAVLEEAAPSSIEYPRRVERRHLEDMLSGLPRRSLVVADAGFIGYDLCWRLQERGVRFLLRVGGNISLLAKELGVRVGRHGTEVWLWPQDRQHKPPLVLRLLRFGHGKQVVYLVTDVHDPQSLPTTQAEQLYRQRWGIEVTYRTIKQTLDRSHWLSRTPQTARAEHTATILAVWILQVLSVEEIVIRRLDPRRWSAAASRDIIRRAIRRALDPTWRPTTSLRGELGRAVRDEYIRRRSERARDWPHKKRELPPGPPHLKKLMPSQRTRGQRLLTIQKS